MIRFVTSRSLQYGGAAVAAVFVSLLLTPRASEAACGDYVLVGGRSAQMNHSSPNRPISTDDSSNKAQDHKVPHRPCQGPGCSNGSFPPQAPASTVVVPVERWGLTPAETLPNLICCSNLLAEPVDLVVDGFRSSILRPPR